MQDHSWNNPESWWPGTYPNHRLNTDKVDYWEMTPLELKRRLDLGDTIVVLDVREPWEAGIARIEGSRLIPLSELDLRIEEELDREEEIVVYCHHGIRSMEAAMTLWNYGFERVKNLAGGISRWTDQVDPELSRY